MSENTGFQFTDDAVPRAYEEVLVPRLFEPWALLLLDECNLRPNAVSLDVATGPGTVARVAAKRIGPRGRVVATDISRPMLDVANSKPSSPDSAPITYIESPAAPLGVESAAFDFVVCQQGLQFFPDRLAALSEMPCAQARGTTGDRRMVPYQGQRLLCGPPRSAARERSRRFSGPPPGTIQLA
jgi:SAM-dependent methyltransferase